MSHYIHCNGMRLKLVSVAQPGLMAARHVISTLYIIIIIIIIRIRMEKTEACLEASVSEKQT